MIREFSVTNLNGQLTANLTFHSDLNLITGRNGSGKTTVLKLLWYLTSGNIERISSEMSFERASVVTDDYSLLLAMSREGRRNIIEWEWLPAVGIPVTNRVQTVLDFGEEENTGTFLGSARRGKAVSDSDDLNEVNTLVARKGASLFFPTFRRIEGGFSLAADAYARARSTDIEVPLQRLATALSVRSHRFVASVSTNDVVSSLTTHYAAVSQQLNQQHRELSGRISDLVQRYEAGAALHSGGQAEQRLSAAHMTLESVKDLVRNHTAKQEQVLRPFTALTALILAVFRHKGIKVTSQLTLGEAQEAIASDKLSAGEKQMLSFLIYNAFTSGAAIFIDEPEISLHVDWQRQLFPWLLAQGTTNQFIIATHSPFIYSKYADKELVLDSDRGE